MCGDPNKAVRIVSRNGDVKLTIPKVSEFMRNRAPMVKSRSETGGGGTGGGGSGGSGTGGSGTGGSGGSTPAILPNKTLVNTSRFVGFNTQTNCKKACDDILRNHGITNMGSPNDVFKLMYETGSPRQLVKYGTNSVQNYKNAVDCINRHIDAGRPIMVGVNRKVGIRDSSNPSKYRNEGTTDHFVVINGRGYDSNTGLYYYTYYEVGTNYTNKGCDTNNNRFIYDSNMPALFDADTGMKIPGRYDVTQVRPNDGNTLGTISQGYN